MKNPPKSLAQAMRERARFLTDNSSRSYLEYGWGDQNSVISALYEMADVIDSWSGEYLSKEETHKENQRRKRDVVHWTQKSRSPMTMKERIDAVKPITSDIFKKIS